MAVLVGTCAKEGMEIAMSAGTKSVYEGRFSHGGTITQFCWMIVH
jgi:hypothetical protein